MKKLMIMMAVALAATVSQAFNVTWSALNVLTPEATDVTADQLGITGAGAAMSGLTVNLFWVNKAGEDIAIGSYTVSDGKIASQVLGSGTDSAIYQAMLADQGSAWKPEYHMTATYTTDDGVYTFSGTAYASKALSQLGTANVVAAANFKNIAGWDYKANSGPGPIPEPTSGILIALGVAGLALRRKQK